jgi:hypothetical protein
VVMVFLTCWEDEIVLETGLEASIYVRLFYKKLKFKRFIPSKCIFITKVSARSE